MSDLLYYLPEEMQASPMTTQDVYNTVATQNSLGNNRISPSGIVSRNVVLGQKTFYIAPGEEGAIQRAINILSLKGGGTLHLTAGTYNVDQTITVPSNVALIGDGSALTIIDFLNTNAQISVVGTNGYTTGTVSVSYNSTAVTGSGTTWTSAMVGRSILLKDFWYTITAVGSSTSLTIGSKYNEAALSGSSYAIATTVDNVVMNGMTLQNSTASLISAQYFNVISSNDLILSNGLVGYTSSTGSSPILFNTVVDGCGTGILMTNSNFATLDTLTVTNTTAGPAISLNGFNNAMVLTTTIAGVVGNGMTLQNFSNTALEVFSIDQVTGHGIEFVSGSGPGVAIINGYVNGAGGDGLKFTATTDAIQVVGNTFTGNTGYGVNIADITCDDNIIANNYIKGNTAGQLNDAGNNTVISANAGV